MDVINQIPALNVPEERREWYFKTIDKKREGFHGFATRVFRGALQEQFNQFFDDELDNIHMFERNVDKITRDPIERAFQRVYGVVATSFAIETLHNFKSNGVEFQTKQVSDEEEEQMEDLVINFINGYVSLTLLSIMESITQTSRDRIAQIINKLQEDPQISISEFKELLQQGYQQVALARSTLIGRTEIIRASNRGMLFSAAATGVPMMKVWVSTRDNRVRTRPPDEFDHLRPDGQERILEQPFNVSGQLLQYPADPSGSPGNTVNCRCTLSFRPL